MNSWLITASASSGYLVITFKCSTGMVLMFAAWCGVEMRKYARMVLASSVNMWLFGLVTWIAVLPSSRSTNAGETSKHVFRMKAGDPSTVPVVSEMSASLWTCIITWWRGRISVLVLDHKLINPVLNLLCFCCRTSMDAMSLGKWTRWVLMSKFTEYFSKEDIPIKIVPLLVRSGTKTVQKLFQQHRIKVGLVYVLGLSSRLLFGF